MFVGFDPDFGVVLGVGDLEVGKGLAVDDDGEFEEFLCPGSDGDDDGVVFVFELVGFENEFLDSLGTMVEEVFGGFCTEEVRVGPSGDRVMDGDLVFGELKSGECGLGMVELLIRDIICDEALFEGLEVGVVWVAEGADARFGEDTGTQFCVEFLPEWVALDHDFEIEGIWVIEADDAGVAVG